MALGGPYARDVAGVMADPSRSGIVYAALTTGEIFRSENSGTVWTALASLGSGIHPYRFVVSIDTPIVIYSLTDAGIYLASSNKRRWERISLPGVPKAPAFTRWPSIHGNRRHDISAAMATECSDQRTQVSHGILQTSPLQIWHIRLSSIS